MKHLNITVRGNVQGVFFRVSTKEKAQELGINGFVRNEPNGTVYIEAEAEEGVLNEFLEWLRDGPDMAYVEKVELVESAMKGFSNFSVQ